MQNNLMTGRHIQLKNISKSWDTTKALSNINVSITAGSFTALLGPSGCGKSTLLRIISGLEKATSGEIIIGENNVTNASPDKRDLSMVFQSYALFPHLSVAENIVFGLRTRREPKDQIQQRLSKTAKLLGLGKLLNRKPSELSGGQQQRVALGRAVIAERSICLMDEPLSNLDAKLRQDMRVELRALQQQLGFTMVYVTHDQAEAMTMADQIILMNNGQVEQLGSPKDLYNRPETIFAGQFIGTPPMCIFSPAVLGGTKGIKAPDDAVFGLRPEDLKIAENGSIEGTLTTIEYFGADALLTCEIGNDSLIVRVPGHSNFKPGAQIKLDFDKENLSIFNAASGLKQPRPSLGC